MIIHHEQDEYGQFCWLEWDKRKRPPSIRTIDYLKADDPPNYPMPAIRYRTVSSLINLGYVSALNEFDIDVVFENYIKD